MTQSRDPKATGLRNVTTTPGVVRQTNALADAMKSVEALRMPQINALTSVAKQVEALRTPQINALTSVAKQMEALRMPQINALTRAAKQVEALRTPQINALTSAAKQAGAFRAPQTDALAAFAHNSAAETARPVFSTTPTSPPTSSSPGSRRRPVASAADLGLFVRERRLAMMLTQQELADAAGTGRRFISELETGKATLEIGKVIQVCRYLGLDLFVAAR